VATAGYSGTPLPRKLGVKEGHAVALVGAPRGVATLLAPLPPGASVTRLDGGSGTRKPGSLPLILFFTTSRADLQARFGALAALLPPDGSIWIAWPKRASKVPTDLTEDVLREVILPTGYVDTKVCAIDEVWSGLRFTLRRERR
jgi:hypothetical protein